jgi:hypothetical protein
MEQWYGIPAHRGAPVLCHGWRSRSGGRYPLVRLVGARAEHDRRRAEDDPHRAGDHTPVHVLHREFYSDLSQPS